jgi:hypothetical protein
MRAIQSQEQPAPMPPARPAASAWSLRLLHHYIGMFIAPSLLFFSLTGALQLLNLHEDHVGYQAPALIAKAGMIHKNQTLRRGDHQPAGGGEGGARGGGHGGAAGHQGRGEGGGAGHEEGGHSGGRRVRPAPHYTLPQALLKGFFMLVAAGLVVSTVLGVVLSVQNRLRRRSALALLALGTVIPIVLALL